MKAVNQNDDGGKDLRKNMSFKLQDSESETKANILDRNSLVYLTEVSYFVIHST